MIYLDHRYRKYCYKYCHKQLDYRPGCEPCCLCCRRYFRHPSRLNRHCNQSKRLIIRFELVTDKIVNGKELKRYRKFEVKMCQAVWPDSCCPTTAPRCPAQLAPPFRWESFALKLSGVCRYRYARVAGDDSIGRLAWKVLQSRLFPPNPRRGRGGRSVSGPTRVS